MRRILFLLLVLSTIVYPLAAQAERYLVVTSCGSLPKASTPGSADGPIAVDINGNLCSGVTVNVPPVSIATPVAINIPQTNAAVDGWDITQGAKGDSVYGGSGSASVISILKGIYNALVSLGVSVTQGTNPWVVTGNALVTQGTTPWQVSIASLPQQTVNQGTSPWVVTGNALVTQSTSPWQVAFNPQSVNQGTSPWITQDNAANVRRDIPATASQWGLAITGAAAIATAMEIANVASSSELNKATAGNLQNSLLDLAGKQVVSLHANRENFITGSVSTSSSGLASIIATPTDATQSYRITDFDCTRNDAGTTAIVVTSNNTDTSGVQGATGWSVPNSGGGGGFMKQFGVPLKIAAGKNFQINISAAVTSLMCHASGYIGY